MTTTGKRPLEHSMSDENQQRFESALDNISLMMSQICPVYKWTHRSPYVSERGAAGKSYALIKPTHQERKLWLH